MKTLQKSIRIWNKSEEYQYYWSLFHLYHFMLSMTHIIHYQNKLNPFTPSNRYRRMCSPIRKINSLLDFGDSFLILFRNLLKLTVWFTFLFTTKSRLIANFLSEEIDWYDVTVLRSEHNKRDEIVYLYWFTKEKVHQ